MKSSVGMVAERYEQQTDLESEQEMSELLQEDARYAIEHGVLVSNLSYYVAEKLGCDETFCKQMAMTGMLHDIGKLRLSRCIYGRQKYTLHVEEVMYVRMHSGFSYDILKSMGFEEPILSAVYHHHENYDGSGYPDNLKGEDIPFGARIIRTCDVYAALVSTRPYREAFDTDTAMDLMIDEVKNFDMRVFLAFEEVVHTIDPERIKHKKLF